MLIEARAIAADIETESAAAVCHCPACAGIRAHTDSEGGGDPANPHYFIDPSSGTVPNGRPIFNWDEAAAYLNRDNTSWNNSLGTAVNVTYAFRDTAPFTMPNGTTGFSQFNADQIFAAEAALQLWADVANITFTRVGGAGYSNNASILFANYSSGAEGAAAFAYLPEGFGREAPGNLSGDIWVNITLADNIDPSVFGEYGMHTLAHEIGHAVGFSHPGDYNASEGDPTYPEDADYWQDSRAYTIMSYFGSGGVGHALGAFSAGPQLHDIAAAQRLYGVNMTTRTGDTIYGYGSNTGREHLTVTSGSDRPVFAVWDAGGNDTFDFSIYSTNSEIDLREEAFSSVGTDTGGVGLAIGNISIARGAVIENAIGGSGADTIIGNAVANRLNGNAGADTITGNEGDDTLIGGVGGDTLNGGIGSDTASYETASAGVTVNMASMGSNTGDAAGDSFILIEHLLGSSWNDILTGDAAANTISGGTGADTLAGGLGADTLDGGAGNDVLIWGWGDGADALDGGADADTLNAAGSAADNLLRATWNGSVLTALFDNLLVNLETVNVNMGGGVDTLLFTSATGVTVNLGAGAASGFAALLGVENVFGGDGDDAITGSAGANRLEGGQGGDVIDGADGGDIILGGDGGDTLIGGLGHDSLQGGAGSDSFTWAWGEGVDTFNGGADFDAFNGFGSVADNNLRAVWTGAALTGVLSGALMGIEAVNVDMGAGSDTILYTTTISVAVNLGAGAATGFVSLTGVEHAIGGASGDSLTGDGGFNRLDGLAGDDVLSGAGGGDILYGGDGADTIAGGLGNDSLQGGAGNDSFTWVWGDGVDTFNGGVDFDTMNAAGGGADDILRAVWDGAALIGVVNGALFGVEAVTLDGGGGVDWLVYTATASVSVNLATGSAAGFTSIAAVENAVGGEGGDTLTGNAGANRLDGFSGNDSLDGGLGADILIGGADADAFVFSSTLGSGNVDSISGFSVADDIIHLDTDIFTAIATGALDADAFRVGAVAADVEDRIIYNNGSGALLYDADGSGAGAAVQFATLGPGLSLTEADFFGI